MQIKLFKTVLFILMNAFFALAQNDENPLPYVHKEPQFDIAPQFKGGPQALNKYFADSIRYPEPEKSKGKHGGVLMKFVITKRGKITKVEAINGVPGAPNFVKEAKRVLESMPRWIPATKNGKKVDADYQMTVPFYLSKSGKRY